MRQALLPCLPDGRMPAVGDPDESTLGLDEQVASDIVACLAPARLLGRSLCAVVTATGPHRLHVQRFEHATVVGFRTDGRLKSVKVDWNDGPCPFSVATTPN